MTLTEIAAPDAKTSAEPRLRTAIAVLMSHFPRIEETFILREINELERRGQPVVIVPIVRDHPNVVHEEASPWMRRARFSPLLSAAILISNLRTLIEMPRRYLRTFFTVVRAMLFRPSTLLRSVMLFPKAVHFARELPALGIRHVHAHFASHATTMAWIMASLSDLTYSFTVHGPDVFVHRHLLAEKIESAKFIRCISTFNKAFLSGLYPKRTQGKLEVVRTGVNPEVYEERGKRAKAPVQLLSVAALTNGGFPILIDAVAQLVRAGVDVECKIVGAGKLRGTAEQWMARYGLHERVRLLGNLPQHEVARLMGECDIFVLPSIIRNDGQMDGIPVSLMEAMAAGKPVVASSISGIPELVRHEVSGLLVDTAYPARIAEAVQRLVDEPELRERFGRAGREFVSQHYDVRRTTEQLITLFDRTEEVNQPIPSVAQRIYALHWQRMHAAALGVLRIQEREEAIVAEVTIGDGVAKQEVIVRQHRAPELARNEFEALTALPDSLTPRLLMFDEPNSAIVTERIDGKLLAGILRSGSRGELSAALRKVGAWLRALQQATRAAEDADGRLVVSGIVYLALQDADLVVAADRPLRRMRTAIRERLFALETIMAAKHVRTTGHHGRLLPENLFVGSRRVDAVDFAEYREGLPHEDVAEVLVHLEVASRHVQLARRSFLDGYGGIDDHDELRLCTLTRALHRLAHGGVGARERAKLRGIIWECVR